MFVKEFEITLENGMKISGELDSPERQGQWKTIILFHGSGPSDRHATVESMGRIVSHNFDRVRVQIPFSAPYKLCRLSSIGRATDL